MLLLFKLSLSVLWLVITFTPCRSQFEYPYVSPLVKTELKEAFRDVWKLDDVANLHYAVSSYIILKEKLPVVEQDVCNYINKVMLESDSLESLYHVTSIAKSVSACSSSQLLSYAGKKVLSARDKENMGVEELFFLTSSLKSISSKITDVSFISKSLKNVLKSNETILNLGYALHIGSILDVEDREILFDKIDSVVTQVDEVDSKYYQFEGGLTLTALVIEGIYKLSESLNKPPPLNNIQLTKFFNYFLSRLSVSRPRGVFALLQVFSVLTDNSFHTYVTVGLVNEHPISKISPNVNIRVSNVFGEPVYTDSTQLTVTLVSGQKSRGGAINAKKSLKPSVDKITFSTTIMELEVTPDLYTFSVSVTIPNEKANKKSIVNTNQHSVKFRVTYRVKIENLQIGVLDSEQSSSSNLNRLEYLNKLNENLSIDPQQRLMLKFSLKDIDFGRSHKVQQVFVKLIEKTSHNEATFVCLYDSNLNYKITIDHSAAKTALNGMSGNYELVLIIGDSLLAESLKWTLATVTFRRGNEEVATKDDDGKNFYKPQPEIKHLFKEPERRPPAFVSNVFTGLVLIPLLILFVLWMKLGINMKNFPFTLSALGFHFGLGSIFVLFFVFWLKLNMFQTIKYLLLLGFVTFLSGNRLLRLIASNRKK